MSNTKLVIVFAILAILAFALPLQARESRIVDGDGLLTEDTELAGSIWRLGLCPIIPDDEYGFEVANMAYSIWPGAFAESKAFSAICIDDLDPATLSPNDIVEIGEAYGVDALLCGRVIQAKFRTSAWTAFSNTVRTEVRVSIAFDLYETHTGTLIWERTLKKDRTVDASEAAVILRRFAGNVAEDMVHVLIDDGITGRDLSLNEPPEINCPLTTLEFSTSAIQFSVVALDDSGTFDVKLYCGEAEEPLQEMTCNSPSMLQIPIVLAWQDLRGDEVTVVATDSQGLESHLVLPVAILRPQITGQIANVLAGLVIINIGSNQGVESGMLFTVERDIEIIDPRSGECLGSYAADIGIIQALLVEPEFSVCHLFGGGPGDSVDDFHISDTVY